jgi:hypothetical protein
LQIGSSVLRIAFFSSLVAAIVLGAGALPSHSQTGEPQSGKSEIGPPQAGHAKAAQDNPWYARRNTFGFFAAYSGDSSHILLGYAENRRLLEFGASYNRRLILNHIVSWQYSGEVLPVALESDPYLSVAYTLTLTGPPPGAISGTEQEITVGACQPVSRTVSNGEGTETFTGTCARRWTIGETMSPVGFQWNFLPRRKNQLFLAGHGGYMFSTQAIPIPQAGSFNFTFDFGAGVEIYRSKAKSIRAEYRYHHISNDNTANLNPGIDNGVIQVTYAFGR